MELYMNLKEVIDSLYLYIKDPAEGLPEDVFLFTSEITPLINVDLLIKNEAGDTLLTWRDDAYYSPGWHIPGGIIRYKETISRRVHAVALNELGAKISFEKTPLAINELIHPSRKVRGHLISLLYRCSLLGQLNENLRYEKGNPKPGEWAWHNKCPDNLISVHHMYQKYL
jgi:ADP-ribose pyrophosphatase YjhB (NUDIX family)